MRAELVIANRGFAVAFNEYDICMNEQRYVSAHLFWRSPVPRYSLQFSADKSEGRLRFSKTINGIRSAYIMQAPIQKF